MVLPRDQRDIPSGANVAGVFPWMLQGEFDHDTVGNQGRFTVNPRNESFKNKVDGKIEIHEVRLVFSEDYLDRDDHVLTYTDRSPWARIQMNTSNRNLIEQWIPAKCLGNRPHDVQFKPKIGTKFRLPAPYFLQHSARFRIDLRLPPNMLTFVDDEDETVEVLHDVHLDIALRGWDPDNHVPAAMNKTVAMPAALGAVTSVSFDEEMDTALRHMVIDDIAFGFSDINLDGEAIGHFNIYGPGGPPYHVDVRFHPNTGPEWVDGNDGWIRLAGICGPPPMTWTSRTGVTTYFPYIVHRPEAPIVLGPKDEFNMLLRMERDAATGDDYTNRYFCWVIGTQEGR